MIVGVNRYRPDSEQPLETLDIDNQAVRESQLARLAMLKQNRNEENVQAALDALTRAANPIGPPESNLLTLAVDAARHRATLGEISDALERAFGRHKAIIRAVSGHLFRRSIRR